MNWGQVQEQIEQCRLCEAKEIKYLRVPTDRKRHPPLEPTVKIKLFFVSVAPPWGGAYFWDESRSDKVRQGLFRALKDATGESIQSIREFHSGGYYLVPAVKCPSEKDGRDHLPSVAARKTCTSHLHSELQVTRPSRVLALGSIPLQSIAELFGISVPHNLAECRGQIWWLPIGDQAVPFTATYFPGNNRHGNFDSIANAIRQLIELSPTSRGT